MQYKCKPNMFEMLFNKTSKVKAIELNVVEEQERQEELIH